jgi:uncharacterized surface protein with fasciclin (FAS1) repeats
MRQLLLSLLIIFSLSLNGQPGEDVMDVTANHFQFSTLMMLLVADREVGEMLKGPGPFTLFAPTDDAINELGDVRLHDYLKPGNESKLRNLLLGHIANGKLTLSRSQTVEALNGESLKVIVEGNTIHVNDADVNGTPFNATNGIVYPINKVLK